MTQITDSTNSVTSTRSSTEARVKSTLASSFSRFSFLKAHSSLPSFTKALITAMPEKLSWLKSLRLEKACWRMSHFFIMYLPITALTPSKRNMGMRERSVISGFIIHILVMAMLPCKRASKNIRKPPP